MIMMMALAAAIASPSGHDALIPPYTVTTSFRCGATSRSIAVAKAAAGDRVAALTANGRSLPTAQMAQLRSGLAPIDQIDEAVPQCREGPDRILIRGHSGSKKKTLMIFFGPNGDAAVREVG